MLIESNALEVAEMMTELRDALPEIAEAAKDAAGNAILLSTTRAMEELIYDQPLPVSYRRYGLEDRTGALLAGEALVVESQEESVITTVNTGLGGVDPTAYAEWRHGYEKLPAPWRLFGLNSVEDELPEIVERAVQEAMPKNLLR